MPLHVEYRSGVARSEICRCRGNHVCGVEAEHEALRDLAVYERSDLRKQFPHTPSIDRLPVASAVEQLAADYQHEVAFEKRRVFGKRLCSAVPRQAQKLVG